MQASNSIFGKVYSNMLKVIEAKYKSKFGVIVSLRVLLLYAYFLLFIMIVQLFGNIILVLIFWGKIKCLRSFLKSYHTHVKYYLQWLTGFHFIIGLSYIVEIVFFIRFPAKSCSRCVRLIVFVAIKIEKAVEFPLIFAANYLLVIICADIHLSIRYPIYYKIKFLPIFAYQKNLRTVLCFILVVGTLLAIPLLIVYIPVKLKNSELAFLLSYPNESHEFCAISRNPKTFQYLSQPYIYERFLSLKFSKYYAPIVGFIFVIVPYLTLFILNISTWILLRGFIKKRDNLRYNLKPRMQSDITVTQIPNRVGNLSSTRIQEKFCKTADQKERAFAVVATILSVVTLLFSTPSIIIMILEWRVMTLFPCPTDVEIITHVLYRAKFYMYPYVILLGNYQVRRLIALKFRSFLGN